MEAKYSRIPVYDDDVDNIIGSYLLKIFLGKQLSMVHQR